MPHPGVGWVPALGTQGTLSPQRLTACCTRSQPATHSPSRAQGFNLNYTKSFIRLLRNRDVLASMPLESKLERASFFCSRQLQGLGLTRFLMVRHTPTSPPGTLCHCPGILLLRFQAGGSPRFRRPTLPGVCMGARR